MKWLDTDFIGTPQGFHGANECLPNCFPYAKFCTPQLIIQASDRSTELNVCSLYTAETNFNLFGLASFKTGTSRWSCDAFDLTQKVKPKNRTVDEQRCMARVGKGIPKNCRLPWIPYVQWGDER